MSSTPAPRPVSIALANYTRLLESALKKPSEKLPSERQLAALWGLSQASVNRAAFQLIAQGRLRRMGYGLYPVPLRQDMLSDARIAVLTHRGRRFSGITVEAARRGVVISERFYVGRDTLRRQLNAVIKERFDGVVFRLSDSGWEWDAEASEMDRLGIPFVAAELAPQGMAVAAEDWHEATGQLVSYLATNGHAELVFLGSLRRAHRSAVVRHAYEERCLRLKLGSSASRVVELAAHNTEAVRIACRQIREKHPDATALVVYDEDHVEEVMDVLREQGAVVPDQLSVVAVGDGANARNARPPVTAAAFDSAQLGHLVLDQICKAIEQVRAVGRITSRSRVLLGATIHRRTSVRTIGSGQPANDDEDLINRTSRVWPSTLEARREEVAQLQSKPHRLAKGLAASEFFSLDISGMVNRSLTRQNGWLGQYPLLHVEPGRNTIHGVPFQIIDERKNGGKAALVLRSQRAAGAHAAAPIQVSIPVGEPVRAVYFLHGCGFAGAPAPFAWYDFVHKGRKTVSLPLVARGLGEIDDARLQPNIQDWWSDFPQIESADALPHVVVEEGDPFRYERYLYTLEWESPEPGVVLEEIRISSNPTQPTTLGLLGVTILRA